MVKGLVALLCSIYDGGEPDEVITTKPVLRKLLGLANMLTPTHLSGLAAVRAAITAFAQQQLASADQGGQRHEELRVPIG